MSCGLSLVIKNYHNRGGDLTLKLISARFSEQANSGRVKLIVERNPDQHSTRLGMYAYLRSTQPGYRSLGFFEMTLKFVKCNDAGATVSTATNVFLDIEVESVDPSGSGEERVTFVARQKTAEFRVPQVLSP